MRYRDQPPPQGYQLVPEVAAAPPVVSRGGRTWTFRLRTGFRFSDGRPVRADAFSQAIHRTMAPGIDSPGYLYTRAIVGAEDVHAGRRARATGVVARGKTLAISFTRPVGAFDAWTTMPFFCAVPPTLPPNAEGVRRFPGSGPYAVEEYRPDDRITIRRNRYYGGDRVHHVDGFDVDLHANSPEEVLGRIEAGRADWGYTLPQPAFLPSRRLIDKYGINSSRFWVTPGLTLAIFALNSARPLFKDNPGLRRAVNLALDRSQFINEKSVYKVTDQLVPPGVPGFTDRTIYPRAGDRVRAKALTAANLRGGNIALYVPDLPGMIGCAQCVARHLAEIGSRSRSGRSRSGRRRRRISAAWATRTSPGTWRSYCGRPISSIPTATSTASSTRRTPAARTSRASTSPSTSGRCGTRPACAAPIAARYTRSSTSNSPRRRSARSSSSSTRRRSSRHGSAASCSGPRSFDDRLPEALRLLHGHPDRPARGSDPGR